MDQHNYSQQRKYKEDCLITDTRGTRYWHDEELWYLQGNYSYYHGSPDQPNSGFLTFSLHSFLLPRQSESDVEDYFQDMPDDSNDEPDNDKDH